jgi:hypothetical protein
MGVSFFHDLAPEDVSTFDRFFFAMCVWRGEAIAEMRRGDEGRPTGYRFDSCWWGF